MLSESKLSKNFNISMSANFAEHKVMSIMKNRIHVRGIPLHATVARASSGQMCKSSNTFWMSYSCVSKLEYFTIWER